jgi:hypothetical protein
VTQAIEIIRVGRKTVIETMNDYYLRQLGNASSDSMATRRQAEDAGFHANEARLLGAPPNLKTNNRESSTQERAPTNVSHRISANNLLISLPEGVSSDTELQTILEEFAVVLKNTESFRNFEAGLYSPRQHKYDLIGEIFWKEINGWERFATKGSGTLTNILLI